MQKIHTITITIVCSLCCGVAIAKDFDPKLQDRTFWERKISKSVATGIINQIPDLIEEQNIKRQEVEQTDDAHLAKLRKKFFTFIKSNKLNQARSISKMMLKKGDQTGERYLQSLN